MYDKYVPINNWYGREGFDDGWMLNAYSASAKNVKKENSVSTVAILVALLGVLLLLMRHVKRR